MKTNFNSGGLGLIVPMNIEALCVDKESHDKKSFKPEPYDFSLLPEAGQSITPYLSKDVMTGDSKPLGIGVHLHWALPDGLTRGSSRQDGEGNVSFPKTPDRWLITRTFSNLSGSMANKTKSWVVESNYLSAEQPDQRRPSLAVPFRTDDEEGKLFRYMGRVLEYETWRSNRLQNLNDPSKYVDGLTAVGYGSATFSASYSTSKNIFGFYDTDTDLAKLGNDIMLSYHVVGWYNDVVGDPVNQLPLQFNKADFERILKKADKDSGDILNNFYKIRMEGGAYVLVSNVTADQQLSIIQALSAGGFDLLAYLMNRYKWSLPSGAAATHDDLTHTLYTGIITNVKWNREVSAFNKLSEQLNIAVGNTASQALAALIAKISKLPEKANVELILDALQLDKLKGITDPGVLNRLEDLATALHTSGYTSFNGGMQWEVTKIESQSGGQGLKALSATLGEDLNELNDLQLQYDKALSEIDSARAQIFMDWYRFIQILRKKNDDPDHGISVNELAQFIDDQINDLKAKIENTNEKRINAKAESIRAKLKSHQLLKTSASRFWQPTEPVVLFQGKDITPPERYGGDGRFMADDTLLCRLSSQLVNRVVIPAGVMGNADELVFDKESTPKLPENMPLDYSAQLYGLFTESSLLNPVVMSVLCKKAGATDNQIAIAGIMKEQRDKYLSPAIPETLSATVVNKIRDIVNPGDMSFLLSFYRETDNTYTLKTIEKEIAPDDLKRLRYVLISALVVQDSGIGFNGIAPSRVYFVQWNRNPWLPYSLSWKVVYYPIAEIKPGQKGSAYDPDFVVKNFKLGETSYEYIGQPVPSSVFQIYKNSIFLSPHAEENFQVKVKKFIDGQPISPTDEVKKILKELTSFPSIFSQSLNGLNEGMVMRNQVMQLEVKDVGGGSYQSFTNEDVRPAVGSMAKSAPSPSDFYNPIRAGFMRIEELTIVDVFGCMMLPGREAYSHITVAQNLKPKQSDKPIYLEPRLAQPGRLQFRWLSAANNDVETNSHPATTPICGWILANYLQLGLWFYTAEGEPLGALNLTEDTKNVIWQTVPGTGIPGMSITDFFNSAEGQKVNKEIKNIALALFNNGVADYLKDFLTTNDQTFKTITPQSHRQTGGNAVLMSSPIAITQATLGIELQGLPAYSNGWDDLRAEVGQATARRKKHLAQNVERAEKGFTKVKFPVRLGNTKQTEDGLLGYFKDSNYQLYHSIGTTTPVSPSTKVVKSADTDIELSIQQSKRETIVTLLLDPRCSVHARTGVLPTKSIDIPPAQFAEALENLQVAFLTSPVLYNNNKLVRPNEENKPTLPVPAQGGGEWNWVERELNAWASSQIQPIDDRAKLSDVPLEIREGWLLLTNFNK